MIKRKKTAQANLDKISLWDSSAENEKQRLDAEAEISRKDLSRFWNPFQCKEIKEKHFYEYQKKNKEIEKLIARKETDETIVNSSPLNDKQAKAVVTVIDDLIRQKQEAEKLRIRLDGIKGVQELLNQMSGAKGGLNDQIAGYDYEKQELERIFAHPLAQSKDDPNMVVPSAVMLHGASGTGKTTMINSIGCEADATEYAKVIDLSSSVRGDNFLGEIYQEMNNAKKRYFEEDANGNLKKTRTVLLINEAEKFLGMTPEQAKKAYGDLIDEVDIERMQTSGNNFDNINRFKTILDHCAEVPKDKVDKSDRSALTIFITTNYPHLIDRDVLRKIEYLAVNPAKGKNMEEVVKYYFKRSSDIIEEIKKVASSPDFNPKDIKHLTGVLGSDAKQSIIKMIEEGKINNLEIPYENIPYAQVAKDYNPSVKKGAFDNKQIHDLSKIALNEYVKDPSTPYYGYFYKLLYNEPRKIDSNRYNHFIDIYNTLAPLNKRENEDMRVLASREKELLLKMEKAGALGDKDRKRLDYILAQDAEELSYLEGKENENSLLPEEKERLAELRQQQVIDETEDDE